jgi:hypothetical protein
MFLYKSTAFRMQKLLYDSLVRAGNTRELMKRIATIAVAFPAAGWMVQGLYNWTTLRSFTDREHDFKATGDPEADEYINAMSHTLALGIMYTLYRDFSIRGYTGDWLTGPVPSMGVDIVMTGKDIKHGEYRRAAKRLAHRVPVLGPALAEKLKEGE